MRNRLLKPFVALTTCCLMLALASPGLAQWRDRDRDRWGGRANVDRLIRQAETRSDQFVMALEQRSNRGLFEQILGGDRLGGLTARAHDLERQLNAIREESFGRGNDYDLRPSVRNVLSIAEDIDRMMQNRRLSPVVERQWAMLRSDLNTLARAYNLRTLG
jgi:hypothetical protein